MRLSVSSLLILVSALVISACGGSPHRPLKGQNSIAPDSFTGGDEAGRAYTGYGPTPELEHVREQVPPTADNREFADQIESAIVLRHNGQPDNGDSLRISMKWKGLNRLLDFSGDLQQNGSAYTGTLRDQSDQKKGFVITVSCSARDCDTVVGYLYFNRVLKAGMIFRKTHRLVQLTARPADYQITRCYGQSIQDAVDKYIQGVKVVVASTEIVPGRSSFKLYEGVPGSTGVNSLQGDLLSTEGDCIPLTGSGEKAIFANICMAGNNAEGGLVFRAQLPPVPKDCPTATASTTDPSLYLQLQDPATPGATTSPTTPSNQTPSTPAAPTQPPAKPASEICQMPSATAHPFVTTMFQDCGHPAITAAIASTWKTGGAQNGGLLRYLKAHRDSNQNSGTADGADYTVIRNVLKSKNIPLVMSFIIAKESSFNPKATGRTNREIGYWQILPDNAAPAILGRRTSKTSPLTDAEWTLIDKKIRPTQANTTWAADILQDAIDQWTDKQTREINIKMVFATYNTGIGNAQRATERESTRLQNGKKQGQPQYMQLSIEDIRHYSEDFWQLAKEGMLNSGVINYVPSVMGAVFSGINPVAAQVTTDASLSFLDLNQ